MKGRILVVVASLVGLVLIALALRATRPEESVGGDAGDADLDVAAVALDAADAADAADVAVEDAAPDAADASEVDAADASATACGALQLDNARALAAVDGGADCLTAPEINCVAAGAVSWGYRVKSASARDGNKVPKGQADWDPNNCTSNAVVELVRIGADGGLSTMPGSVTLEHAWNTDTNKLELTALSDYDGDGEVELLRQTEVFLHEGTPRHGAQVLSFKKGALSPYAKAPAGVVWGARDFDDDGLVDLLTRGPYDAVTAPNVFGADLPIAPVMFAAHAQRDGSFSLNDAAASAFAKQTCPSKPALDFSVVGGDSSMDDTAKLVVCARLWGASEQEIVVSWKTACGVDAGAALACQSWVKKLAAVAPPFKLQ